MVTQAVAATGFSGMALQVVLLYMFQVFFGYLYFSLGLLITFFMLGLASGSIYMIRELKRMENPRLEFLKILGYLALLAVFLPRGLDYLSEYLLDPRTEYAFYGISLLSGVLVGMEFPLAVHLLGKIQEGTGRVAGKVYAADLLGACIGAFFASSLLLPLLGVVQLLQVAAGVLILSGMLFGLGPK